MNSSRYLILSLAADLMWICIFSPIVLKRQLTFQHGLAFFVALIGYLLFDMIVFNGSSISSFNFEPASSNWRGPIFCVLSRMFSILSGVISKRILLRRGYQERVRERLVMNENTAICPKDLDEHGMLKPRYVKKSSVIYKRAQFYKTLNNRILQEASRTGTTSENTTEKSKSRISSEDTNFDKKRALENLRRLKRSSIDRLLRSKQAFIKTREALETS